MKHISEIIKESYPGVVGHGPKCETLDQDTAKGEREAKLELIKDVMSIYEKGGIKQSGEDFNRLYDLSINRLHREVIIAQDKVYYKKH